MSPNTGIYAPEAHCLVKTIRVSRSTGKVTEGAELFRIHHHVPSSRTASIPGADNNHWSELVLLQATVSHTSHSDTGAKEDQAEEEQEVSTESGRVHILNQDRSLAVLAQQSSVSRKNGGDTKSGEDASESANIASDERSSEYLLGNTGITKSLVLFDRTDPEFDEDSDPDGDLDL